MLSIHEACEASCIDAIRKRKVTRRARVRTILRSVPDFWQNSANCTSIVTSEAPWQCLISHNAVSPGVVNDVSHWLIGLTPMEHTLAKLP